LPPIASLSSKQATSRNPPASTFLRAVTGPPPPLPLTALILH
jgi:hypothetical protein